MADITVRHDVGQGARPTRALARSLFEPMRHMRELFGWPAFRELLRGEPLAEMLPAWREGEAWFAPDFDVKETPDALVFRADLPGIDDKDVEVTVSDNRLVVRGKREAEAEQKGETWYTCERSYGSFMRSFALPPGIDTEHVEAGMDKGVLTIHVPKAPEAQPKKIQIGGAPPAKGAPKPKA